MGANAFTFPHGISVGIDGFVYTADSRDHTVRKWTKDGRHVLTLGSPHLNAPTVRRASRSTGRRTPLRHRTATST